VCKAVSPGVLFGIWTQDNGGREALQVAVH